MSERNTGYTNVTNTQWHVDTMEHVHCIENMKHQLLTTCLYYLHLNNVQVTLASSKNVQVIYKFMPIAFAYRQGRRQNQYVGLRLARPN